MKARTPELLDALAQLTASDRPLDRRSVIRWLGSGAGATIVAACTGGPARAPDAAAPSNRGAVSGPGGTCVEAAEETSGPFPADGVDFGPDHGAVSPNVLTDPRVFRTDLRADFDGGDAQAGVPLTLVMTLQNAAGGCAPLSGYYVYLWHANRGGHYSAYRSAMNGGDYATHSWLRGIGRTDAQGRVRFTTCFPGRYFGRATHLHYAVYPDAALRHDTLRKTSQLAFPDALTHDYVHGPYANAGLYPTSQSATTANAADFVFSDGTATELLTVTGDNQQGYLATITVAVAG